MVLEFVPGETLQNRLANLDAANRQLPLAESINIMATTGDAVAYAHSRGMIHRDLKPANLMLTPNGQPILMDFGVAKMLGGTHHTATGAIVGTAKYMSPEQARGERPDERTDIYSLGVMLYELVAGQPPFDADTTVAVLMQHVTQPVPDIRSIRNDVPDDLVAVVEKALEKKPENRYQTAAEMANALRAVDRQAQPVAVSAADLDSTLLDSRGLRGDSISSVSRPASVASAPAPGFSQARPAQAKQSGGIILWIVGAVVAVLILLLGVGAVFLYSGLSDSATGGEEQGETAVAVAPAVEDGSSELPPAAGMVRIAGDTYTVGYDPSDIDHAPSQEIRLDEFWLDRYEVTNAQYAEFLAGTGAEPPANWPDGNIPTEQESHPVMGVTWDQAAAFCRWAHKRLPTEAEWEVAARGAEGRLYPWGNDQQAVELPRSGSYEVGSKPTNQTPSGLFDMAGNVWEWVAEPYAPVDEEGHRLLRGGANGFVKDMAYRLQGDPTTPTMVASAGIRCAASQVDKGGDNKVELAEGVLYQDTFADPGTGWPVLVEGTRYFGYHPPDFYHIELSKPETNTAITRPPDFDDVTVESEVRIDHTESEDGNFRYGLIVRRMSEEEYYAFVISYRTGTWQVIKNSPGGQEILAEGSVDTLKGFAPPGFTPDQSDQLRVDVGGSNFAFHINQDVVAQVSDTDYPRGEAGFYVETFDEPLAHVHFDALTIRELEPEALAFESENEVEKAVEIDEAESPTPTATEPPADTATPEPAEPTPVSDTLPTEEATEPPAPTAPPVEEAEPTAPPTATATPTSAPPTPTAAPSTPEDMVLIPAGSFEMGSASGEPDEAPPHEVSLNAYFIDKTEVSNADYRACVNDGGCPQTSSPDGFTRPGYRDDPAFNTYPVVGVNWDQAAAYCRWAGRRLPTEAEWEYAARGPDSLTWPWGNSFNANLSAANSPDTEPVNSFPGGASPFGVFNMAGNVNEWVQDAYDANFYASSPAVNPVSTGGNVRVFRGGSFANPDGSYYTTSRRYNREGSFSDVDMGFRCALDLP